MERRILLGRIAGANGIRGEVRITTFTARPQDIAAYGTLDDGARTLMIEAVRATGKGVVAIEGRVRDGASGEIIGMFADREHPGSAIVDLKALRWWEPAKAIIDDWSRELIALANNPPGAVVKQTPQFELLVW